MNQPPTRTPPPLCSGQRPEVTGWYVHIPFCFHKCHYCDFYSIADGPQGLPGAGPTPAQAKPPRPAGRMAPFIDRLVEELGLRSRQVTGHARTVFVGGGTPTWLPPDLLTRLLNAIKQIIRIDPRVEFTVEANPETVTPDLAGLLADGGVNRISIGAQTFQPHLLKVLERWHEPSSVGRAVRAARDAGVQRVNLDLIFAIPGQTPDTLAADLDAALSLDPDHLSCYALTYEPNTPMTHRLGRGEFQPAGEPLEADLYAMVMDRLAAAGYEQYEVSNWARPGARCGHNLLYWSNANWIGLGPSAASHIDGHRWKNAAHLGRYLAERPEPPTCDHEALPPYRRVGEAFMLGLRLRDGVSRAWADPHLLADPARAERIEAFAGLGLVERTDTHLRLTRKGLFVADSVIAELL